jgi:hypothetical protein
LAIVIWSAKFRRAPAALVPVATKSAATVPARSSWKPVGTLVPSTTVSCAEAVELPLGSTSPTSDALTV